MPTWSLFGSTAKKKSAAPSVPTAPAVRRSTSIRNANVPIVSNVSTLSSVEEIMRSVSEVAVATDIAKSSAGGDSHPAVDDDVTSDDPLSPSDDLNPSKLIVKKCICCGTKLQVPEKLPYFKCAICDTFHGVGNATSAAAVSFDSLSIEELESIIEKIREKTATENVPGAEGVPGGDRPSSALSSLYTSLDNLLLTHFSSVDSINKSFALSQKRLSYSKPNIDFTKVEMFFTLIMNCPGYERPVKTILTSQLNLLKRLKKDLESPLDICFLLVIIENPILYIPALFSRASADSATHSALQAPKPPHVGPPDPLKRIRILAVEVLERTIGIITHCRKSCRHYLLNWLSRYGLNRFQSKVDLFNSYVAHRLLRQYRLMYTTRGRMNSVPKEESYTTTIPSSTAASSGSSSSTYHRRAYSTSSTVFDQSHHHFSRSKKRRSSITSQIKIDLYNHDWKISAFVRVLSIFFNANTVSNTKIPISNFYNTMVDYVDVTCDFDEWQKTSKSSSTTAATAEIMTDFHAIQTFAFCQYPFILSMGSKTEILEHDARRQMELKAQEAFFGSLTSKIPESPFLHIKVNRNSILQDSFEAIDKNEDNLKKGLRVEFMGEPGIDAGGLKKEWFLLLFKELFDPVNAFFIENEESHLCWFDTNSEHSLKYYKLTGVAIGLALYNSTILDVNFPKVLFKKLLGCNYTLDDFIDLNPSYGRNLKKLLDYEGDDLEHIFCLDFSVYTKDPDDSTKIKETPLIPNGKNIMVNKSNRHDYVKQVMSYYLDTSVKRQFEAFKHGFYKVAGGNALSLFRPEEIELLIRGSLEPIDVDALRSVTRYQHWGPKGYDAEQDIVIKWFWKFFKNLDVENQRKLLIFVTGSDRIPATGIANMPFRISKIGDDCERFPISHTCFNQLCLYKYSSREKLVRKLMTAINESEGFGIK